MIRGLHGLFYSSEPDALRDFLRDKLRLPHTDVGAGWLIFDLPEADLGVHPTEGKPPSGTHDLSFYCDDLPGTVKDLESRGVKFRGEIEDHGYGLVTYFAMPGGLSVQLYEPRYVKNGGAQRQGAAAKSAPKAGGSKASSAKAGAKKAPVKAAAKASGGAAKKGAKPAASAKKPAKASAKKGSARR